MEDIKNIKTRSIISLVSLVFQSGYSAFLGLVANLVLTIMLSPSVFGIYITVLSILSLLNYFSDIGLAASLIQKKDISDDDVKTAFTVQEILILTVCAIAFLSTTFIKNFYKLPQDGVYLFWILLISFFISSLKTIPSIFLERKIQFQKIVLVQVIENTVFYLSVIICALMGMGLKSFTISVFIRAIVGLITIYSISFWIPRIGISLTSLKALLSFGLTFQASSFLALFKDDLITLFLGKVLGFEGLGYVGWAKKWAEAPIRIIMDNVSRVLFPVISRMQNDTQKIGRIIEKIISYQTALLAPVILGMIIMMNTIVHIIPKYGKWEPALPLFYLFCISAFFSSFSTPFMNVFNSLGKVKKSFYFMLFWTIITWIFTPLFTKLFGYYGFPITQLFLSLTCILVILEAKKLIHFSLKKVITPYIITALIMGAILYSISFMLGPIILTAFILPIIGATVYFICLKAFFNINLYNEMRSHFIQK
jgi:O-antigen/teichoic acid export membrane protein